MATVSLYESTPDLDPQAKKQLAQVYNYIGRIFYDRKDYYSARDYMEKVVKLFIQVYGHQDINVALKYDNLAKTYERTKQVDKALDVLQKALKIKEKEYATAPNKSYATTLIAIASIYQQAKQYDIAIKTYSDVLTYIRR